MSKGSFGGNACLCIQLEQYCSHLALLLPPAREQAEPHCFPKDFFGNVLQQIHEEDCKPLPFV